MKEVPRAYLWRILGPSERQISMLPQDVPQITTQDIIIVVTVLGSLLGRTFWGPGYDGD